MNEKEWKEFGKLVDGECYSQIEDFGADAALKGVQLALSILDTLRYESGPTRVQALRYIYYFSEWQNVHMRNLLSTTDRNQLELWDEEGANETADEIMRGE